MNESCLAISGVCSGLKRHNNETENSVQGLDFRHFSGFMQFTEQKQEQELIIIKIYLTSQLKLNKGVQLYAQKTTALAHYRKSKGQQIKGLSREFSVLSKQTVH